MNVNEAMPTFVRWYQAGRERLRTMPRAPYVAFLIACVITTAITPITLMLDQKSLASDLAFTLFIPLWLPVVAGDLALLYWCRDRAVFKPSLLMRLFILTLIMEGLYYINHYVNPPAKPPDSTINEETMNQVLFMSLWGVQCVMLLILEPGLRWWQRRRLAENPESFFSHPLS